MAPPLAGNVLLYHYGRVKMPRMKARVPRTRFPAPLKKSTNSKTLWVYRYTEFHKIGRIGTSSIIVISLGQLNRSGGSPCRLFEPAPADTLR